MSGTEQPPVLLHALLTAVGVYFVGQGLLWLPWLYSTRDLLGDGFTVAEQLRLIAPFAYGSVLVLLSRPLSRILGPGGASADLLDATTFAEALLGAAGLVLVGLGAFAIMRLTVFEVLGETLREVNEQPPLVGAWRSYVEPGGQVILGLALLIGRRQAASRLTAQSTGAKPAA